MSHERGQRSGKLYVAGDDERAELEKARREAEASRGLAELATWVQRAAQSRRLLGQPTAKPRAKVRTKAQIRGRARSKAARQMRKRQRRLARR